MWCARVALVGYAVWLGWPHWQAQPSAAAPLSLWDLPSGWFWPWVGDRLAMGAAEVVCFAGLGLLAALSWPQPRGVFGAIGNALLGLFLGLTLAVACSVSSVTTAPDPKVLILPWLGVALGAWLGWHWSLGRRGRWALLVEAVALCGACVAGAVYLVPRLLHEKPQKLPAVVKVSDADRQRLTDLLQHPPPPIDGRHHLELLERDVNTLANWGLASSLPDAQAAVALQKQAGTAYVVLPLGKFWGRDWILNVQTRVKALVDHGRLAVKVQELRLGDVDVPAGLLRLANREMRETLAADETLREHLAPIESAEIVPGRIEVVCTPELFGEVIPALVTRHATTPELLAATRVHLRHLLEKLNDLPKGEDRFGECFETAFAFAEERSESAPAEIENRAAIYALAILIGHPSLEHLIGKVGDPQLRLLANRRVGYVTLRGRDDWARHFVISAAIALLSSENLSDAVGMLKEHLDSDGGSGFSFADLLADRAGTLFAQAATRDAASAAAMQSRLAAGFEVDDFFPRAEGLPEGISREEFASRYGNGNGAEYQRLVGEIESRLAGCAGLRAAR